MQNKSDVRHTFSRAHIGNTAVYFVGTLTIHEDDGTEQEYVYYTTDKNVTNKTVYAVLKSGTAGAWIRSLEPTARWKWLTAIVTAIR